MLNRDLAVRQRGQIGKTQRQMADALGVTERSFARWERGEVEPSIERLTAWAQALGIKPADLLVDPSPEAVTS